MPDYYVTYRDIEDLEPRQSFELMTPPPAGARVVTGETLPRLYGHKTIHIRWHHRQLEGNDTLYLVTYTQTQLTPAEIEALISRAIEFVYRQNQ